MVAPEQPDSLIRPATFNKSGSLQGMAKLENINLNDPSAFRELSFPDLKEYAERWARKYSDIPILKILLYRHSSKLQEYTSPNKRLPYKYAIVFEVPDNIQSTFKHYDDIDLSNGSYSLEYHKKLLLHYSEPYEK